jgi:ferredoxin
LAFLSDIANAPWSDRVTLHVSSETGRADFDAILPDWSEGAHVYCCGGSHFMDAAMAAAERKGFPDEARHVEYFTTPELPDYENHPFTLKLASGKRVEVAADRNAAECLIEAGVAVDLKCSDGLCGVCRCGVVSGEVEHRDFVLSKAQRQDSMILCQSRAARPGGEIEIDL